MIEEIKDNNEALGVIIYSNYKEDGIKFFTPNDYSLQLAYMNRPTDYSIEPHVHCEFDRLNKFTQEVLFIKSGQLRVDFYNLERVYLKSRLLNKGDVILLVGGGHGFKIIDSCEIIEVKQGPYAGDRDKIRFNAVADNEVNFN
jgi:mannose-6-phosphate isomerase-like protein (cupin superfamily)